MHLEYKGGTQHSNLQEEETKTSGVLRLVFDIGPFHAMIGNLLGYHTSAGNTLATSSGL